MKETRDEKLPLKIAFAVIGLIVVVFIGYFTTTVALDISYAPTTEPTEAVTEESSDTTLPVVIDTTKSEEKTTQATTELTTIEEPEREINVTSQTDEMSFEEPTEDVTELFTGY